jgi:hypothetical protein
MGEQGRKGPGGRQGKKGLFWSEKKAAKESPQSNIRHGRREFWTAAIPSPLSFQDNDSSQNGCGRQASTLGCRSFRTLKQC